MLKTDFITEKFNAGLSYDDYLATGKPEQQEAWTGIYNQVQLTADQRKLIAGFTREMHVIISSGIWCGDCVQQGPLLQRIAEANTNCIKLVWLDRDEHADLAEQLKINAGLRVPVAVFAAEDNEGVSIFGDRTITRYRAIAAKQLGASCPLPGGPVPTKELQATMQDWLDEFERVQLLLRLSGRLREKHGD
jgi:thiol-disulfide isomerase/thioredoxin